MMSGRRHMIAAFGVVVIVFQLASHVETQKLLECGPMAALRVCSTRCASHSECPPPLLCCPTRCGGAACLPGVTARNSIDRNIVDRRPANKPGLCPEPTGPWVCGHRCRDDSDCTGFSKCCPGRCGGLACVPPI